LTFTIRNTSVESDNVSLADTINDVSFTDTMPSGITIDTDAGVTDTCLTPQPTLTETEVTETDGSVSGDTTCTVTVTVTGTEPGTLVNTTSPMSYTIGSTPFTAHAAVATINVVAPPTISKAFGVPSIGIGTGPSDTTTLTFTLGSPAANPVDLTGVGFTDPLPSGIAFDGDATDNCSGDSGTVTETASVAEAGDVFTDSGETLTPGEFCTIVITVNGVTAGNYVNTTSVVTSTQGGNGLTASAPINVGGGSGGGPASVPRISKAFAPTSVPAGTPAVLTVTITNPSTNTTTLSGVTFTDPLPGSVVVATPPDVINHCGGTVTADAGAGTVSLTSGNLAVGGSCTVSVHVESPSDGTFTNVTDPVSSTTTGPGGSATAVLTITPGGTSASGGGGSGGPGSTAGVGSGGCAGSIASGNSDIPGGNAAAVGADLTADAYDGEGTVTVGGYNGDPLTQSPGSSVLCYFDVQLSSGSSFTSVVITDCALNGGSGLEWFNPAADGGAGAWQGVTGDPGPTLVAGNPTCMTFTLTSSSSPSVSQLGGTVFAVMQNPEPAVPAPSAGGYTLAASDGGVFGYGSPGFLGSAGGTRLDAPIVGTSATPGGLGYWLVSSDGGVFTYGNAAFHGSAYGTTIGAPIVGMAATPDGGGYWLVSSDGGVFTYGDAGFYGSAYGIHLTKPIVGIAATPDGGGYWLVSSDGGVFTYGDAGFHGSAGGLKLDAPVVGIAPTPDGGGYWLVAADGGVFTYGDAGFHGSAGGLKLDAPVVGIAATPDGGGYLLAAADGGVFNYGDATFLGSAGGTKLDAPIVGIAAP
jgi:hypothetical protein